MPALAGPAAAQPQPPRPPPHDRAGFVRRPVAEPPSINALPAPRRCSLLPPGLRRPSRDSHPLEEPDDDPAWLYPQASTPCRPLTSDAALKLYAAYLDEYERVEVLSHRHVYFLGSPAVKVKGSVLDPTNNHGYDDEDGDYVITPHDHLAYRYEILGLLGRGAFGQVVKVYDYKTQQVLACKIIRNRRRYQNQAMTEVRILNLLMQQAADQHVHVVRMVRQFTFRRHLCIVFEMLGANLYEYLATNDFRPPSPTLLRRFAVQILLALKHLHDQRIVHADLKPENILLANRTTSCIKIIDFGSSCFVAERAYTYLQSRYYRAPEVILGVSYGCPIDMWSLGCVLAELATGRPLLPGEDEAEQLALMMALLGPPPRDLIDRSARKVHYFDPAYAPLLVPNSRGEVHVPASTSLAMAMGCPNDDAFLSLLAGCLQWDPRHRLTADQALQHEWIVQGATLPAVKTPPLGPRPPPREATTSFSRPARQPAPGASRPPVPPPQRPPATLRGSRACGPGAAEGAAGAEGATAVGVGDCRGDVRLEHPSPRQSTQDPVS
eukprot:EG_transcript_8061